MSTSHPNAPHTAAKSSALSRLRKMVGSPFVPVVLLLAAVVMVAVVWSDDDRGARQQQHLRTMMYAGIALIGVFSWFVVFSPFRSSVRRRILFTGLAVVTALSACFRIEGVDGDLLPIVRWRLAARPDRVIEPIKVVPKVATKDQNKSDIDTPSSPIAGTESEQDFPQFLGKNRNGKLSERALQHDWAAHPPRLLWERPIGAAWSAFSVAGQRAVTQEQRGESELVVCYDLTTGNPLWSHADQTRYDTTIAGIGPRASPTIAGGAVYTLGATGILNCLDLVTGQRRWRVDTLADTQAPLLDWGMAGSPLVEGDLVIINTGGKLATLAAYDRATGQRRWTSGSESTSYASPTIHTMLGQRQIVMQNQFTVTGHAIEDGKLLWSHPAPGAHPKVAQPVALGSDRLLISSGYGTGSDAFELTRDEAGRVTTRSLWKNVYLKAKFANIIEHEGFLYGLNDGTLVCLEAATGQRQWRGERYGHGQLLLIGEVLLIQAESGEVVLVEAKPGEFKELSRFTAFTEKTWNSPALSGRLLLVRNDRMAACFELPVRE